MKPVPLAMNPPTTDVTIINTLTLEEAIVLSRQSARKRIIFPYHKQSSDKLHRMLNVIQPGSYIRPHDHSAEGKSESVILLRGGICFMTFDAHLALTGIRPSLVGRNFVKPTGTTAAERTTG